MFIATLIQVFLDESNMHAPVVTPFFYGTFPTQLNAELYAYQRLAFRWFELITYESSFSSELATVLDDFYNLPVLKKILQNIRHSEYTFYVIVEQQDRPVVEITSQHVDRLRAQMDEMSEYNKKKVNFYEEQQRSNARLMQVDHHIWQMGLNENYKRAKYDHSRFELDPPQFEPIFIEEVADDPKIDDDAAPDSVNSELTDKVILKQMHMHDNKDDGVGITQLRQELQEAGFCTASLAQTMQALVNDGEVYTTIDDDHFKCTFSNTY